MPKPNEELAAGEAAPAPVAMPVDSVSEVNDQLASTKLSDQDEADATVGAQDEAKPPADAAVRDTDTMEYPDLWKAHPPTEECPVCMVPLPLESDKCTYWACCSKRICTACCEEHDRALAVTNRKREKKKQPPLEKSCAFCRSHIYKNDAELVMLYDKRVFKDDTRAMINLAGMYLHGLGGLRKNNKKFVELLNRAAGLGSAEAIGQLGAAAANGWLDSTSDTCNTKAKEYLENAAKKGDVHSRHNLGNVLEGEGNFELAIKHWHLAAAAGDEQSMKYLWECFSEGRLSKADLEKALRAHKAACDEMNSEERERYDASQDAEAGNDELLTLIYQSYYFGYLNAKELKVALKAHRTGDFRAVQMLLKSKVRTHG